jgi:hypothetical protein
MVWVNLGQNKHNNSWGTALPLRIKQRNGKYKNVSLNSTEGAVLPNEL